MKKYSQRGFTLIELLVVIAIIGILSSVVLASLSTARNKGKAATIKAGLASLRSQMEIKADGGSYGTGVATVGDADCNLPVTANYITAQDPVAANIITNIIANAGAGNLYCSTDAVTGAIKFAAAALLPDGTGVQCVDSSGNTKLVAGTAAPTAASNLNNGVCI